MSVTYNGAHSVAFLSLSSAGVVTVTKSWDDLFLIPAKRLSVTPAQPNYSIVSIPGSNSYIDISQKISGALTYGRRSGSWEFYVDHDMYSGWAYSQRRINALLNGKRLVCVLKDDPAYPYSGRIVMKEWQDEAEYSRVVIDYDFDYEYDESIPSSRIPEIVNWVSGDDGSGTAVLVRAQEKVVSPTVTQLIVKPDFLLGYNYLGKVTINEVPYQVTSNSGGGDTAFILCDGRSGSPQPSGSTDDISAQAKTVSAAETDVVVTPDSGYDYLESVTISAIKAQEKNASASTSEAVVVTPDSGYDYLKKVTIARSISGGGSVITQSKTVQATNTQQTVSPDSGYDYLENVIITPPSSQSKTVTPSSSTDLVVTPDSGYSYLSSVTVRAAGSESEEELEPYTGSYTYFKVSIPPWADSSDDLGLPVITTGNGNNYSVYMYNDSVTKNVMSWVSGNAPTVFLGTDLGECTVKLCTAGASDTDDLATPLTFSQNTNAGSSAKCAVTEVDVGNGQLLTGAFSNSLALRKVRLSNTITSIPSEAFYMCGALQNIYIPSSVTSIGNSAFFSCESLISIVLPAAVTSIGTGAFAYCRAMKRIEIPDSVAYIGNSAFRDCHSLASVYIPRGITTINEYTFYDCESLKSVVLPDTITSIGQYAFMNCFSLESVDIPDSVSSIGSSAFRNCRSLFSISLPSNITEIDDTMFNGCKSLTSMIINNSVPISLTGSNSFSSCEKLTIYVPSSSLEAYKTASGWSDYADRIYPIPEEGS